MTIPHSIKLTTISRTTLKFVMFLLYILGLVLMIQGRASAFYENTTGIPLPTIPNQYGNYTSSPPGTGPPNSCPPVDYAVSMWGSPAGLSSNTNQITVSATAGAVNLQYNIATAVCNQNVDFGSGTIIRKFVQSQRVTFQPTTTVSTSSPSTLAINGPVAGQTLDLNFACIHLADFRYVKQCNPSAATYNNAGTSPVNTVMQLSGLGSLAPGVHTITVNIRAKVVTDTLAADFVTHNYSCVNPVGQPQGATNNLADTANNCTVHNFPITFVITKTAYPTFNLDPTVACDINSGNVTFNITKSGPASANNITVTRTVVLNNPDGSTTVLKNNEALSPNLNDVDFPYNEVFATGVTSGQSIDASITVNPGSRDGNNNLGPAITRSCPTTPVLSSKPYLRVYGHDTVTGLPYVNDDGSCSGTKNTAADIKTFTRISGNDYIGAGSQFAASAAGTITEFSSESLHSPGTATHDVPDGLTFGNDGTLGGDVAGYVGCLPDYLDFVDYKDSPYLVNNLSDSVQMGSSPKYGQIQYYNKDVNIVNDVIISGNPTWSSIQDLQSGITDTQAGTNILVVKGNVSIRPSVNRFDGIIIAVPDPVSGLGGIVNTCVPSGSNKYDQCINKLEINGAIIAKQVLFNRLNGDTRTASVNELPSNGNIAEVINFPAENFLILSRSDTYSQISYKGKYDSIVGLPPIL